MASDWVWGPREDWFGLWIPAHWNQFEGSLLLIGGQRPLWRHGLQVVHMMLPSVPSVMVHEAQGQEAQEPSIRGGFREQK